MEYDWTRFKKQVFIRAEPPDVFRAWALPREIVRWFIAEATYIGADERPRDGATPIAGGDRYHWRWHQDLETTGTVREVVPDERIVLTFGKRSPTSSEDVLVTVEVDDAGDGTTLLSLTQENMADTPHGRHYHLSCNLGWSFFITNLKGLLEHGVDLRETDPERAAAARAISAA